MEDFSKLLSAISSITWPLVTLFIFIMILPILKNFYAAENLTLKIAGFEVSASKVANDQIAQISDIQVRIARLESNNTMRESTSAAEPQAIAWVDDNPENNAVEIALLEAQGVKVYIKQSTIEGLDVVFSNSANLVAVITDVSRVERGTDNPAAGDQLVRAVRDRGLNIPIIVYTLPTLSSDRRERLISAGATYVVTSPIDLFRALGI